MVGGERAYLVGDDLAISHPFKATGFGGQHFSFGTSVLSSENQEV